MFSARSLPRPAHVLVAAAAGWALLVVAAPPLGLQPVYAAAHLVCHQIPARTFHVGTGPVAVCARCFGIYLGAVAGGAMALVIGRGRRPGRPATARLIMAVAAIPTLVAVAGEWVWHWPIGNLTRFAAALPLGTAAAWLVTRALEVDWRE